MGEPTREPVLERILQDVEATLLTIKTTNLAVSYWNDVNSVKRWSIGMPHITDYPALVIHLDTNTPEDQLEANTHAENIEQLSLEIAGTVNEAENVQTHLIRLNRDVRTALMIDPKRGTSSGQPNARHTFMGRTIWHDSEAVGNPYSSFRQQVRINYRTRMDDLEATI